MYIPAPDAGGICAEQASSLDILIAGGRMPEIAEGTTAIVKMEFFTQVWKT